MAPGVGPAKTQTSPSLRKRPEGMAVPGIIFAGSVIQRAVQAGCRRSCASKKFGAEALLSCASLPLMWHFKHGAGGPVEWLDLRRNERVGLCGHGFEKQSELANFIVRKRERGHAHLQILADAGAIGVGGVWGGIGKAPA